MLHVPWDITVGSHHPRQPVEGPAQQRTFRPEFLFDIQSRRGRNQRLLPRRGGGQAMGGLVHARLPGLLQRHAHRGADVGRGRLRAANPQSDCVVNTSMLSLIAFEFCNFLVDSLS
jgi:hypothetical protein